MFYLASAFNRDLNKWDVSKVTNMEDMFSYASSFNQDLSRWDVYAVTNMVRMFLSASYYNQELCGAAWVYSKANKEDMFTYSPGSISSTPGMCTRRSNPDTGPVRVMV